MMRYHDFASTRTQFGFPGVGQIVCWYSGRAVTAEAEATRVGRGRLYRVPVEEDKPEAVVKARQVQIVNDLLGKVDTPEFRQAKLEFHEDPQRNLEVLSAILETDRDITGEVVAAQQRKRRQEKKRILLLLLLTDDD
jgi:hypothetical protein